MASFRLNEPLGLNRIAELGADAEAVQSLSLGGFIAWNRLNEETLKGSLF